MTDTIDTTETPEGETPERPAFDLNMHVARLLMDEPFFASLSRRVNKVANTAFPTAGVLPAACSTTT